MTTNDLVRARLDTLIQRLEHARLSVISAGSNARLHKRAGDGLATRVADELANLRGRRKLITSDQIPSTVWSAVSNTMDIDLLFDECLTYIQAARSRGPDVAPDLSEITDMLFEELAGKMRSTAWRSYSTFSSEDSFDLRTDIVRLRYPLCDIWDIPVTVHEFGHFMSPRLVQKTAQGASSLVFQKYKKDFQEQRKLATPQNGATAQADGVDWWTYLDEMFADMFATFALGPAFACTCIVLRFDPLTAQTEADGRHPSYSRRVYSILQTLRRMDNEPAQRNQMQDAIMALAAHWKGLCESAKTSSLPGPEDQKWMDIQISNLYEILRSSEPELRFTGWNEAKQKQAWFSDPVAHAAEEIPIAEILNAAWLLRMKPQCDPQRLSSNFMTLCQGKTKQYDQ